MAGPATSTLPHHAEAEKYLLGGILRDPDLMDEVVEVITPEDLFVPVHRRIYEAMCALFRRGEGIDYISVLNEIGVDRLDEVGGVEYLYRLSTETPLALDFEYYLGVVKEKSLRRQILKVVEEAGRLCLSTEADLDTILSTLERHVFQISQNELRGGYRHIGEILKQAIENLESYLRDRSPVSGVPTGFYELDDLTNGFQNGDLIIIAGRPGMGKTAFILNVALNAIRKSSRAVLFFSLEMSGEQLVRRLLSADARVDQNALQKGRLNAQAWEKVIASADRLQRLPLYIDDGTFLTVPMMLSKARRLKAELGRKVPPVELGMVVVDYLQLLSMDAKAERRELEVSMITRALKMMAKELKVPVVALSQLNRGVEARSNKRPLLSDLRESGAIEQDADLILFLYRDELYDPDSPDKGIAEVIIGKQRNGPLGTVQLAFFPEFTLFAPLAHPSMEQGL
jgi:replicative DNA helicase